jgi:sulfite exporter TauE/SafE
MEHQPLTASYWRSAWRWLAGFGRLGDVPLKPGWRNGPLWWAVYAVDYGAACVFLGIGVQPISRWAGERIDHQPWRWLAALLNRLDAGHTSQSGGLLWGTLPCRRMTRYMAVGVWALATAYIALW